MAINPLELQTLFSQINNAGKIQSTKEVELLKQEIANSEIMKKSEKESEDVPETKNLDSHFSKINEQEKKKKENKEKKNLKQDIENEEKIEEDNEEDEKK